MRGVALDKLMVAAGFEPGKMGPDVPKRDKRAGWKKALRLTAADGFQTVLSCGEVWPELGRTRAMVVWRT